MASRAQDLVFRISILVGDGGTGVADECTIRCAACARRDKTSVMRNVGLGYLGTGNLGFSKLRNGVDM